MYRRLSFVFAVAIITGILAVSGLKPSEAEKSTLPPEPTVTYSSSDAEPGQAIEHGELISPTDEARKQLHAQHHPHGIIETRRIPGTFQPPARRNRTMSRVL